MIEKAKRLVEHNATSENPRRDYASGTRLTPLCARGNPLWWYDSNACSVEAVLGGARTIERRRSLTIIATVLIEGHA